MDSKPPPFDMFHHQLWFNLRTGERDHPPRPWTYAAARDYIPQDHAVQGLFSCYEQMGMEPLDALTKALECVVDAQKSALDAHTHLLHEELDSAGAGSGGEGKERDGT